MIELPMERAREMRDTIETQKRLLQQAANVLFYCEQQEIARTDEIKAMREKIDNHLGSEAFRHGR